VNWRGVVPPIPTVRSLGTKEIRASKTRGCRVTAYRGIQRRERPKKDLASWAASRLQSSTTGTEMLSATIGIEPLKHSEKWTFEQNRRPGWVRNHPFPLPCAAFSMVCPFPLSVSGWLAAGCSNSCLSVSGPSFSRHLWQLKPLWEEFYLQNVHYRVKIGDPAEYTIRHSGVRCLGLRPFT